MNSEAEIIEGGPMQRLLHRKMEIREAIAALKSEYRDIESVERGVSKLAAKIQRREELEAGRSPR